MSVRRVATLKDVAEQAGVSKVAVSVVLNNTRSNVGVSEATRQRILDCAARLSYRPNAIAQSLRRRSTNVIGFYSGSVYAGARGGMFFSQIIAGLQDGCETHSRDLLVHGTFRGQSVDDIYLELASGKIDGLVLHAPGNDALVSLLTNASLPCVVVASPVETLPSVVVDDAEGMRMMAKHIAAAGHTHVAFRRSLLGHTSSQRRSDAFCQEASELGVQVTITTPSNGDGALSEEEFAILDGKPGDSGPSAFVCWNDSCAHAVLGACVERGLRVPRDIAVTGFDGFRIRGIPRWDLTTLHAPWREVAQTAVNLLVAHMSGEEIPMETRLPVTLDHGNTI